MIYNKIMPTNKKFGYFFSVVFLIASMYFFFYSKINNFGYLFAILTVLFFITSILKAELLLPLNKLWMKIGILLGIVVSPIILGIIFFGLITPYGLIMRLVGRDEMKLKRSKKETYWILRPKNTIQTNFKNQF
ncbi:hypothetical protein IDH08_04445 [Pelagibacterales bacterium SAG-MED22]|nr:hypothetical protein [Pelagibacterales bacterium SAG-MED22]